MHVKTGDTHYAGWTIFDTDGTTPLTGQAASCTTYLQKNGAAAAETVTVAEISSTGRYYASFASAAAGFFHLSVTCPDDRVHGFDFEVEDADLDSMQTDVTFIKNIEGGGWKIDESTNKQTFYESDNSTVVAVFSLKDIDGNAASDDVYQRDRD
jgi:hypothetical protein